MYCPNCGTSVPDGSGFCMICGFNLAEFIADEPELSKQLGVAQPKLAPIEPNMAPSQANTVSSRAAAPFRESSSPRWPIVIAILMCAALVISIYGAVSTLNKDIGMRLFNLYKSTLDRQSFLRLYRGCYIYYGDIDSYCRVYFAANIVLRCLCCGAAAVLFFAPTRKKPVLTAIPRWILVAVCLVGCFAAVKFGNSFTIRWILYIAVALLPQCVLYTIGSCLKTRSRALAIVHLALSAIAAAAAFGLNLGFYTYFVSGIANRILAFAFEAFFGAAYSIAMFCFPKASERTLQ